MTTAATFYTALQSLAVTGVTNLSNPPTATELNTATFPVKWLDSIGLSEEPLHRGTVGGQRVLRARLIVITDAIGQDRHAQRWAAARAMVDTLNTALKTLTGIYYGMTYRMEVDPRLWEGYYAVVCEIEVPEVGD